MSCARWAGHATRYSLGVPSISNHALGLVMRLFLAYALSCGVVVPDHGWQKLGCTYVLPNFVLKSGCWHTAKDSGVGRTCVLLLASASTTRLLPLLECDSVHPSYGQRHLSTAGMHAYICVLQCVLQSVAACIAVCVEVQHQESIWVMGGV